MKKQNKKYNLKIGIIGCGGMARVHLGYILENVPKENVAVCDLDEIRSEAFTEEFQIGRYFNDIDKMLTQFKPDICHIVTPPHTHVQVATQCMNGGSHVFIEKPMCTTSADADKIISVSNKTQRLVCVGHQRLFEKPIIEAKRLLESGKLGSVVHVSAVDSNNSLELSKSGFGVSWAKNLPGGMFFDYLPHLVYLLEYFIPGLNLKNAYYTCNHGHEVSDLYANFISTNAAGSLHISLSTILLQNYIRIECTKGIIHIDSRNYVTLVTKKSKIPGAVERIAHNLGTSYQLIMGTLKTVLLFSSGRLKSYEGTGKLIDQFYDAVLEKGSCPVPPEKGKDVVSLCEDIISIALNKSSLRPISNFKKEESLKHEVIIRQADAKILVTGGTGFIGRHLIEKLANNGQQIRVLSRCLNSNTLRFPANVEVIRGDVFDKKIVDSVMRGIGTVYHLAAATRGNWTQHLDSTVIGTKNVLDSMTKHAVNKLVYVSSVSVYDQTNYHNNSTIDEEFPYERRPYWRGNYCNAKLKAEKLVRKYMGDGKINAYILRPGMVYGPGRPALSVLPPHITLHTFKKALILIGKGKKKLNLIYVENLLDALILAGKAKESEGHILNIVDTDSPTQSEYVKLYKHLTGQTFLTFYIPIGIPIFGFKIIESIIHSVTKKDFHFSYKLKSKSKNISYNIQKIENVLGWKSKVPFMEGLKRTINCQLN